MKKLWFIAFFILAGCSPHPNGQPKKSDLPNQQMSKNLMTLDDESEDTITDDPDEDLTSMSQSELQDDLNITQAIRQALMDSSLSISAKNVKVITINRMVTLRGEVNSDEEKNAVAEIAQQVQGVQNVNNQLEVSS